MKDIKNPIFKKGMSTLEFLKELNIRKIKQSGVQQKIYFQGVKGSKLDLSYIDEGRKVYVKYKYKDLENHDLKNTLSKSEKNITLITKDDFVETIATQHNLSLREALDIYDKFADTLRFIIKEMSPIGVQIRIYKTLDLYFKSYFKEQFLNLEDDKAYDVMFLDKKILPSRQLRKEMAAKNEKLIKAINLVEDNNYAKIKKIKNLLNLPDGDNPEKNITYPTKK